MAGDVVITLAVGCQYCSPWPWFTFLTAQHFTAIGWYPVTLLGDRGTSVLTTCLESLPGVSQIWLLQ